MVGLKATDVKAVFCDHADRYHEVYRIAHKGQLKCGERRQHKPFGRCVDHREQEPRSKHHHYAKLWSVLDGLRCDGHATCRILPRKSQPSD